MTKFLMKKISRGGDVTLPENRARICLLAGGIPMDLQGKQWKWYGEDINNGGGMTGRSSSWAACEYFYEYCRDNTGYGLVCDISENLYRAWSC